MSNRLSSVYHGMESRQDAKGAGHKAPFSRPYLTVGGVLAVTITFSSALDGDAWIGLVAAAVVLVVAVALANRLLIGLTIIGAIVGLAFGTCFYSYMAGPILQPVLAAAEIGFGAGALLAGLIALVRETARRS